MSLKSVPFKKIFLLFLVILSLFFKKKVYGESDWSDRISATIRLSICGDEFAEGEEDCDRDDLNNQTCLSLGYGGGDLICDIACDFDVSDCLPVPTVTPTPTFAPTPTSIPDSTTSTSVSTISPTTIPSLIPTAVPVFVPVIPEKLFIFDIDKSGKIELTEVYQAVKLWVDQWRKDHSGDEADCDVNDDGVCNLIDFSILLYYMGKQ